MENESQPINQHHAVALADFFHCSLDYLFAREFQVPEKVSQAQAIVPETVIPELHKWNLNQLAKMSGAMELEVLNRSKQGNGIAIDTPQGKFEPRTGGSNGLFENAGHLVKK